MAHRYPRDINLLVFQTETGPRPKTGRILFGIVALVVAVALAAALPAQFQAQKEEQLLALEQERARYSSDEFFDLLPRRSLLLGYQDAIELFESEKIPALEIFDEIHRAVPAGGFVQSFYLSEDGTLGLTVSLGSALQSPPFSDGLRESGLFSEVVTNSLKTEAGGRCTLSLTLNPPGAPQEEDIS